MTITACPQCGFHPKQGDQHCRMCGASTLPGQVMCTECGHDLTIAMRTAAAAKAPGAASASDKNRTTAALLGLFFNAFGAHKFYLGYTREGWIMLIGGLGLGILTAGVGALPMTAVGIIEGLIYLSKSEEDFQQTYVVGHKGWF